MKQRDVAISTDTMLSADALVDQGLLEHRAGRYEQAVALYRRAIELDPANLYAHRNMGVTLQDLGRAEESLSSYKRALAIKPDSAETYNNLGIAYASVGELDQAFEAYHQAISLNPDFLFTYHNLAILCEQTNRLDEAAEVAGQGMLRMPHNPVFKLIHARCLRRSDRHEEAAKQLEDWIFDEQNPEYQAKFRYELARDYDSLGEYGRAFGLFSEANRLTTRNLGEKRAEGNTFRCNVDVMIEQVTGDWCRRVTRPVAAGDDRDPVFLIGFPRSGTTLLEQILDSHPMLQSIEEKPLVNTLVAAVHRYYPVKFPQINDAEAFKLRELYFNRVNRFLPLRPDSRLVDKLPLNILHVGLIHRVFPGAKFILAMRHPCDACLSCFMQDFEWNPSMDSFLDLDMTVRLYDKVMTLWRRYAEFLPIKFHLIRYEDLVEQTEEAIRELLAFLELRWDEGVLRYTEHANRRGVIRTPSYYEVTRPVYRKSRYRWLHYAEQLKPHLGILKPHIDHFGYASIGSEHLPAGVSVYHDLMKQEEQAARLIRQSRYQEVISLLEPLVECGSATCRVYCYLGASYQASHRLEESIVCYEKAIALCPDSAEAHSDLGICYALTHRFEQAVACCEKAIALNPRLWPAYRNLATLYEQANRISESRDAAERGLAIRPDDGNLHYLVARCERYNGEHEQAVERLNRCLAGDSGRQLHAKFYFELGQNYNSLGDYESAFHAFERANELAGQVAGSVPSDRAGYLSRIEQLYRQFSAGRISQRRKEVAASARSSGLAFLVGFPRSGTTLLDQMLDAHPQIRTIEEKPLVQSVLRRLRPAYPEGLLELDDKHLDELRSIYRNKLKQYVSPMEGGLVIDKLPLNIIHVGLIHRLFPDARFIVSLRHPCDVCLSCFMQDFKWNEGMNHFYSLVDTANLYHHVMRLWQRYREVLPLEFHTVKYESLVENFEGEARLLLDFLGVDWDDAVLGYASHARTRGVINTPSHFRVTQPIDTQARYRWLNYQPYLQGVMGLLQPHIDAFGY